MLEMHSSGARVPNDRHETAVDIAKLLRVRIRAYTIRYSIRVV